MIRIIFLFGFFSIMSSTSIAKDITIAVAANFAEPIEHILSKFKQKRPEIDTKLVVGSSGKLFAQIQHGAPFDLFLSADQQKPTKLKELDLIVENSQVTYAQGNLILWSETIKNINENTLANYSGKIAIANPKLAPYGLAAKQVLQQSDNSNITTVNANNVIGALQYAQSNSVDLALVSKSSLIHKTHSTAYWEVGTDLYSPILQDMVIIKNDNESTRLLWAFILTEPMQALIEQSGYTRGNND